MPRVEGLTYFGSDLPFFHRAEFTEAEYLSYFAAAGSRARVGEKSAWYLYSRRAAAEIRRFNPDADIIIMLRNPVDMMASLHRQRFMVGAEDIEDFAAALDAEDGRRRGLGLPVHLGMRDSVLYRRIAGYAEQVARYLDEFGRNRVHVILFDDLERDMPAVYADTLRFLKVREDFRPEFRVVNAGGRVSSPAVARFLGRPPAWLRRLGTALLSRSLQRTLIWGLNRLNAPRPSPSPTDPDLRRRLQAEFAPEVDRLAALIGRDLSHWRL